MSGSAAVEPRGDLRARVLAAASARMLNVRVRTPDGREVTIERERDRWAVRVQSGPLSVLRFSGHDLPRVLARAAGLDDGHAWIAMVAADADRSEWKPLSWRR